VLAEAQFKSRFEALRSADAPLVGRNEEIELLLRRWEQIKSGEGRVILISADPGVGKSRLTTTLIERLGSEPYRTLRYFCLPHHEASALFPFINQLERAAGFEPGDTPQEKLDKLEALLAAGSSTDEAVAADRSLSAAYLNAAAQAGEDLAGATAAARHLGRKKPSPGDL
jgi:predicted ATPase